LFSVVETEQMNPMAIGYQCLRERERNGRGDTAAATVLQSQSPAEEESAPAPPPATGLAAAGSGGGDSDGGSGGGGVRAVPGPTAGIGGCPEVNSDSPQLLAGGEAAEAQVPTPTWHAAAWPISG
jgi:hypothetical protein